MSPKAIRLHIEGCLKRKKEEWERTEYQAWLGGYFTMYAIGANFSKKIKYPENPLTQDKAITDISNMDEEEIANAHQDFLEKLDLMARTAFGK